MNQLSLTVKNEPQKELTKFQSYIFYFFIFSFFGWVLETLYSYAVLGHFANRGFFYGPICPIYGCAGIMLLTFLGKHKSDPLKFFINSIIVFSVFEYAISYGLDALYNMHLWDYNTEFLNINGRICLLYSLIWGFVAIAFVYVIVPFMKKLAHSLTSKLPVKFQIIFIRILSILFIIDILYSFIEYSYM